MYNLGMLTGILAAADANPRLKMIVAVNPQSGPGDNFVGFGNISAMQNAINQLRQRPNITVIGYIASWYGKATDNPPQGNQYSCDCGTCNMNIGHCDVVYCVDPNQFNQIITTGVTVSSTCGCIGPHISRKALLVQRGVDIYANSLPAGTYSNQPTGFTGYTGVQGLMIDEFSTSGDSSNVAKRNFYQTYTDYARSKNLNFIIGNPGSLPPTWAYSQLTVISCYESTSYNGALTNAQQTYIAAGNDKQKVKILLYNIAQLPTQTQILQLAQYAGLMYIATDNSWQSLPPYFNNLCAILATT